MHPRYINVLFAVAAFTTPACAIVYYAVPREEAPGFVAHHEQQARRNGESNHE